METIELGRLLANREGEIDLGRGALMVARAEYPDLDLDREVARLDRLAAEAARAVDARSDPARRVSALRSFLAGECAFRGNEQDYYDPKNSCLNEVLNRRTGIPITLSVVYMEIGRRVGLSLFGVGLPSHFLVKYQDHGQEMFLDPFHGGRNVTRAECREMVERMYQGQIRFQESFLAAVDKRYILLRMLNNLRSIYLQSQQLSKALRVVEMILAITPASGEDLKQRALIQYKLQDYRQARHDLESYLFLNPRAADAEEVKTALHELRRFSAMLN